MPEQPNILFLLSDEHSYRYMGHVPESEGGETIDTPALDRLAAGGTRFSDAYCQMPLCTPSRISLLCGKEVRKCGAWANCSILRPELATIPGTLADAGYETCLVGKMHLGGDQQFVGFRHRPYGDLTGDTGHQWEPLPDPRDEASKPNLGVRGRTTESVGVTGIPESLLQEEIVARESLAFLREHRHAAPDQPWFLCASFSRPHFPLTAPRRFIEKYAPDSIAPPKYPEAGDAYDHPMSVGLRKGFRTEEIDHDEMMRARAAYFACVAFLDEMIGDMLCRLEKDGLLDNTVIVYATDHGEMAGEHGVWWKNGWYEGCTRSPLIISTPEQRRGDAPAHTVRTPVALLDLYPTLCGLAGAETPGDLDGIDLSESVRDGTEPEDRPVFSECLNPRWGAGTEFRSIRWKGCKYVRFRNAPSLFFNLEKDPGEQHDLIERGMDPEEQEAHDFLEQYAQESIDFDAAEEERTVRDADLPEKYPKKHTIRPGNFFILPSGLVVDAEQTLYSPDVLTGDMKDYFGDIPPGGGR